MAPGSGCRCPLSSPTQTAEMILDQLRLARFGFLWWCGGAAVGGGPGKTCFQLVMMVCGQRRYFQFGGKV